MEIAILMAAGLGSRMRPLTERIAKPLVKVHGRPMIETVIDGLRERGIARIYVVVGYHKEQFSYLAEKYEGLTIVENTEYLEKNNISSVYVVSDILCASEGGAFICEADLYIPDAAVFQRELPQSCYFGRMVAGRSEDWVFDQDADGRITRVGRGGDDCYNMVGISYFTREDAALLGRLIQEAYARPGHEQLFWDEVVDRHLDQLRLTVAPVAEGEIVEIDTVEELARVDESYL